MPGSPSSSPMIAKMKSLCGSERLPHFSRLWPSPTPSQPPSASAYRPCSGWRAAPSGLVSRPSHTSKRPSRFELVTMKAKAIPMKGTPGDGEPAHRDPRREEDAGDDRPEDHDGAEVVAHDDDGDGHRGQRHEVGQDDVPEGAQVAALAGEHGPAGQGQADLDRLRRLDAHRPEADPVLVALEAVARAGRRRAAGGRSRRRAAARRGASTRRPGSGTRRRGPPCRWPRRPPAS